MAPPNKVNVEDQCSSMAGSGNDPTEGRKRDHDECIIDILLQAK